MVNDIDSFEQPGPGSQFLSNYNYHSVNLVTQTLFIFSITKTPKDGKRKFKVWYQYMQTIMFAWVWKREKRVSFSVELFGRDILAQEMVVGWCSR